MKPERVQSRAVSVFMVAILFSLTLLSSTANGQAGEDAAKPGWSWQAFPDEAKFKVHGLHWFAENNPRLWRMPVKEMDKLPKGVQNRSKCVSGGRIVLRTTATRLALQAVAVRNAKLGRFDVYINGQPGPLIVGAKEGRDGEVVLFQDQDQREKEVVIYLPHLQDVEIKAVGVDTQARFSAPSHAFARPLPVVFYGSSVCQGSGAQHPAQTYESILCRELNLDFVNLGFGGAGKAEPNVVALVNAVPGSGYVFDLGKSYGDQDATAFKVMLQTVRRSHPDIPIIVLTPITSVKEVKEPAYAERSIHTRTVMREPVKDLIAAGDKQLVLVEGEDLLGFKEHGVLSKDGVHPSDQGYALIAKKLLPVVRQALGL